MTVFKCIIFLLDGESGGLKQSVKDGMMPSFNHSGELVACRVLSNEGVEFLTTKELLDVNIEIAPYLKSYSKLGEGTKFKLNIASQVIGHGIIIKKLAS